MTERVSMGVRDEAGRGRDWLLGSLRSRDAGGATRAVLVGGRNVVVAATDRLRADRCWCPCCDATFAAFRSVVTDTGVNHGVRCPRCDAAGRHRALAIALAALVEGRPVRRVLHFAPEASLAEAIRRSVGAAEVVTTDRHRGDVDRNEDIRDLGFGTDEFDLVLCNHVLEHVDDDGSAIAEMARVTAPGGLALVTVPGDFRRAATVSFDRPSPNGHLRDYGLDLADRLGASFASCRAVGLGDLDLAGAAADDGRVRDLGVDPDEVLFVCEG